jgi:hypothetical protein
VKKLAFKTHQKREFYSTIHQLFYYCKKHQIDVLFADKFILDGGNRRDKNIGKNMHGVYNFEDKTIILKWGIDIRDLCTIFAHEVGHAAYLKLYPDKAKQVDMGDDIYWHEEIIAESFAKTLLKRNLRSHRGYMAAMSCATDEELKLIKECYDYYITVVSA